MNVPTKVAAIRPVLLVLVLILALIDPAQGAVIHNGIAASPGRYKLSNGCEIRPLPNNEYTYKTPDGKEVWGQDLGARIAQLAAAGVTYEQLNAFQAAGFAETGGLVDPQTLGRQPGIYNITGGDGGGVIRILPNGRWIRWNSTADVTTMGTDLKQVLERIAARGLSLGFQSAIGTAAPVPPPVVPAAAAPVAPTVPAPVAVDPPKTDRENDGKKAGKKAGRDQTQNFLQAMIQQLVELVKTLVSIVQNLVAALARAVPAPPATVAAPAPASETVGITPPVTAPATSPDVVPSLSGE